MGAVCMLDLQRHPVDKRHRQNEKRTSMGARSMLVPGVGIEPTLLSEPDFESGASTNFTTRACSYIHADSRDLESHASACSAIAAKQTAIITDLRRSSNMDAVLLHCHWVFGRRIIAYFYKSKQVEPR
jgi:hypothetical protein